MFVKIAFPVNDCFKISFELSDLSLTTDVNVDNSGKNQELKEFLKKS